MAAYWTYEERVGVLTPPLSLRGCKERTDWEATKRLELGFSAARIYRTCWFHCAKKKDRYFWLVLDRTRNPPRGPDSEDQLTELEYAEKDLEWEEAFVLAEGVAPSKDAAWRAACEAAGTDRLELGDSGQIEHLNRTRNRLKNLQRLETLNPSDSTATTKKYLYGHAPGRNEWDLYDSYKRHPFLRYSILRETKLFYFVNLSAPEYLDQEGNPGTESKFRAAVRIRSRTVRMCKDLWGKACPGERPFQRLGSGWESEYVCRTFAELLEDYRRLEQGPPQQLERGVLEIPPDLELTPPVLQRYYRKAVMKAHPDKGGSPEAFQRVQDAMEQIKQSLR